MSATRASDITRANKSAIGGRENRRAPRFVKRRRVAMYSLSSSRQRPRVVDLRDVSTSGVGFTTWQSMQAGAPLILRLVDERGRIIPVLFHVVHCRATESGYQVGAALIGQWGVDRATSLQQTTTAKESHRAESAKPQAAMFHASDAMGFNRQTTLQGKTLIGWDREIDLRNDGDKLWICVHSPGKQNGWGIFVDRAKLIETMNGIIAPGENRFEMRAA